MGRLGKTLAAMTPCYRGRYIFFGFALGLGTALILALQTNNSTVESPFRSTLVEIGSVHEEVSATGKVVSSHEVIVSAAGSGHLVRVYVKEGDSVDHGQILAHIDDREAIGKVHKATISARRAKEEVLETRKAMDELRLLFEAGGEPRQAVDDSEAKWRAAKARIALAQDELQLAQLALENCDVRAPFSGVITSDIAKVGQWVAPGAGLFMLVDPSHRELEVQIDASEGVSLSAGQPVVVTSDAFQNIDWPEHVIRIASTTNRESKLNTIGVRISAESVASELRIGQQVDVLFQTHYKPKVPRVLSAALISRDGRYWLGGLRDGRVHLVQVKRGISNMAHTEILEGINVGEEVILHEGKILIEGDRAVTIVGKDISGDTVR